MTGNPTYPRVRNESDGSEIALNGRLVTVGASSECALKLAGKGLPKLAAHFLFKEGRYQLQGLSAGALVKVNGREPQGPVALAHEDALEIVGFRFKYLERPSAPLEAGAVAEANASGDDRKSLARLIESLVSLLRERDADVFSSLVASVSRLLRCDAARVVEEDSANGERRTIARYPAHSGLERFSNRAIDWSKESSHAILLQETDWEDEKSIASLRKNAICSILCVALREEQDIIGYLYMDRIGGGSLFTESDREFCDTLSRLFEQILAHRRAMVRQKEVIARLQSQGPGAGTAIIHSSPVMGRLLELAVKMARTGGTVLIRGETGTGKELLARFVHEKSLRKDKPFLALNCGAIPENLIESELFGHEKGAFTGADQRKIGLFESADGGTIFLDEIGDLPLGLQVRLLRVLQESEITRIGNPKPIKVDVRILSATHRNLTQEVKEARFRQDLFFRLSVLDLELPPLRERGQDVLLLADYLLKKYLLQFGLPPKNISAAGRNKLLAYAFPGNVRELENVIQKAILLSNGPSLGADEFQWAPGEVGNAVNGLPTLKEARSKAEKKAIADALEKSAGNVSLAAKLLDIDRKWLMKLMEESNLRADDFRK